MGRGATARRLPVLFLLVSLGVAGFGALEAYRAQRSHTRTSVAVLEDYGSFAAWSYAQRASQLLTSALDASLGIARRNVVFALGEAGEECLLLLLSGPGAECECGPARVSGGFAFFTRLGEPADSARWAGLAPGDGARRSVVRAVQAHARATYRGEWPAALVTVPGAGGVTIAYTRVLAPRPRVPAGSRAVPDARRDTLAYGIEVDPERLGALFARALEDGLLLPPALTRGHPNPDVIAVEVLGPTAELMWASRPSTALAFAAGTPRPEMLGGGTYRASVLPEMADQLIIGGLPEDRTPLLVLIFALAGALAALALVQLRREDRLAALRQDFVASVSHELRTPLAQVRLFTETLKLGRTRDEGERSWALDNIDRETLRLTSLVENILHFSRAERGVRTGGLEPGDLAATAAGALASFRQLVPERKATFESSLPGALPAELHHDSIRQVALNLLDNAVRYGPAGQVIRVVGERRGGSVRIAVEDGGPGVLLHERERIFEPFHRGGGAVGTVVVGSGIGLSVVREIVSAHGGRVWVEDAPSGGARFVVELPALHTARSGHFRAAGVDAGAAPADGRPGAAGGPYLGAEVA